MLIEVQPQHSLGTVLDLCFLLGQNRFPLGTAQLLPLRKVPDLLLYSSSFENLNGFFIKLAQSLVLRLFIFLFSLSVLTLPALILHRQSTLMSPFSPTLEAF